MKPISSHRAFTLLELLTVVAIVGLLVALIVPALSGVRDRATAAGCISNLRSIGSLMTVYAADHDGYLPIQRDEPNQVWPFSTWMGALAPYAGVTIKVNSSFDDMLSGVFGGVFRCPGKKDWRLVGTGVTDSNRLSYSMNSFDVNSTKGVQRKLASIQEPARTLLVADTATAYYVVANSDYMYNSFKALRHQNADNVLFCDGHVQAVKSGGLDVNLVLKH